MHIPHSHIQFAAGSARAHLQSWVAAAGVITRAARAWLFRRAVRRLLAETAQQRAAATALQAAWRGRAVRVEVAQQRAAAVCIQVRRRVARPCSASCCLRPTAAAALADWCKCIAYKTRCRHRHTHTSNQSHNTNSVTGARRASAGAARWRRPRSRPPGAATWRASAGAGWRATSRAACAHAARSLGRGGCWCFSREGEQHILLATSQLLLGPDSS